MIQLRYPEKTKEQGRENPLRMRLVPPDIPREGERLSGRDGEGGIYISGNISGMRKSV